MLAAWAPPANSRLLVDQIMESSPRHDAELNPRLAPGSSLHMSTKGRQLPLHSSLPQMELTSPTQTASQRVVQQ